MSVVSIGRWDVDVMKFERAGEGPAMPAAPAGSKMRRAFPRLDARIAQSQRWRKLSQRRSASTFSHQTRDGWVDGSREEGRKIRCAQGKVGGRQIVGGGIREKPIGQTEEGRASWAGLDWWDEASAEAGMRRLLEIEYRYDLPPGKEDHIDMAWQSRTQRSATR